MNPTERASNAFLIDSDLGLPTECMCEVFKHITDPSDFANIRLVSKHWRSLVQCYETTYIPLYHNLLSMLPAAMPKLRIWHAFQNDVESGLTGGPVSWYKYNCIGRSFDVVLTSRDSVSAAPSEATKDLIVKPRVEAARTSRRWSVRQVPVTCVGLTCQFPTDTALTPQQRLFVEKAVKDVCKEHFGTAAVQLADKRKSSPF